MQKIHKCLEKVDFMLSYIQNEGQWDQYKNYLKKNLFMHTHTKNTYL